MDARKKSSSGRQYPNWMYSYPDERDEVIERLVRLMGRIDFGTPTARGIVPCRIKIEDAVAIQKELASANRSPA